MAFDDLYFRSEIAHAITGNAIAALTSAVGNGGGNTEYVRGVLDTVRANASSFGIPWSVVVDELRAALGGQVQLIDAVTRLEG